MTVLEILWILGTIFCMWITYKLVDMDDGTFIITAIISIISIALLIIHFKEHLTTQLW